MDYKQNHAYNYGYLKASVKQSIPRLKAISAQLRGEKKKYLDDIIKCLTTDMETTEANLDSTSNGQQQ